MRYEHIPRPEIENHYHIRELIEGQAKRAEDRTTHQNREKEREERDKLIQDSKEVQITDFFCGKCQKDFKGTGIRQIEKDWNGDQNIAHYKTKCFCGKWCIRLITDRHKDGYWMKSRAIAKSFGDSVNL